jgi:hypothetical protein
MKMSEETKKQFLLVCDDVQMAFLSRVMPGIQFVEVRAMNLSDNKEMMALVTPAPKAPEVAEPAPEVAQ